MKLKNLLYATVGSAVLAFSTASCSDYLDISGEFNASLGVDQVWDNATYTRNWYGVIYRNLMEYSETGSEVNAFKIHGQTSAVKSLQKKLVHATS